MTTNDDQKAAKPEDNTTPIYAIPNNGWNYCPYCGKPLGGYQPAPYYPTPYPWYPSWPYSPFICTTGGTGNEPNGTPTPTT